MIIMIIFRNKNEHSTNFGLTSPVAVQESLKVLPLSSPRRKANTKYTSGVKFGKPEEKNAWPEFLLSVLGKGENLIKFAETFCQHLPLINPDPKADLLADPV